MKFTIKGKLIGLNEYINIERSNRYKGAKNRKDLLIAIALEIKSQIKTEVKHYPVRINVNWYEPNKRRDFDNIVFAKKFIGDALCKCGILKNDNLNCIYKWDDEVLFDPSNPRIEVEIIEQNN